jgi:hypothetical protein
MDAISSLGAAARFDQAVFDGAAAKLAAADLPRATRPNVAHPDPTDPAAPSPPRDGGDVVGQIVTMNVAVDMHHVTTAALRSAFTLYRDSIDLLRPEAHADQ